MKVGVVGLGKAGLPLAAVIADSGIIVKGIDIDKKRVESINSKKNPIPEEPELGGLIEKHAGKNLIAVDDISKAADCDSYIIIVPLFIDDEKKPDFSILDSAFKAVSGVIDDGNLVVLETTVPPGTTRERFKKILDESGKRYHLAYSPERIMTGYSVSRYREFPKVIGGMDEESSKKALSLYGNFCSQVHPVSDIKTAEMVKVSEGIYRDVNIALANELYKICEEMGVDYFEMRKNALHDFCHLHIPGNVGGHCIPVYPWFLLNSYDAPLMRLSREINDGMIEYYAEKLKSFVRREHARVMVIGITYREGVKELAYSRGLPMVSLLKQMGYEVYVYDPMYSKDEITAMGLKYSDDFQVMDGIILMNDYPVLKGKLSRMKDKVVDIKNCL